MAQEHLNIKLGEEFYPFKDLEDTSQLREGKTGDVFFQSEPFYLEGEGEGSVRLTRGYFADAGALMIYRGENNFQLADVNAFLGRLDIDVDVDKPPKKPGLSLTIRMGEVTLYADDSEQEDPIEPIMFYSYYTTDVSDAHDLLIEAKAASLRELVLKFDR